MPLTTMQVVGTLNRQKDRAPVLRLVWKEFGPPAFADFVTPVDDLTFQMHLAEPTLLALSALGPQAFAPQIVTEDWYTVPAAESAPGPPNGTGPYMFESSTPGDRWSAVRFPGYTPYAGPSDGQAGGHVAYLDRVEYIYVPDANTRAAALQTGEVDVITSFASELLPDLEADPNVAMYDNPPLRLSGHFNHILPPFNNRQVRQALVMAYRNQDALLLATGDPASSRLCPSLMQCGTKWETDAGSAGFYNAQRLAYRNQDALLLATGDPASSRLCPSLMQCGTKWETDAGSAGFYNAQRLDEARQMVKDAGYEGYTIRLMDPVDRQPAHGAAQVTQEVLLDLGFDVDFQVMDWATMVARRTDPNAWEFFHTWSGAAVRSGPAGHLMFTPLQFEAYVDNYQDVDGTQRALFSQLARATAEAEQKAIMDEFQAYFYQDAIFLQVGEFFSKWAATTRLKGIVSGPGDSKPYDKWLAD